MGPLSRGFCKPMNEPFILFLFLKHRVESLRLFFLTHSTQEIKAWEDEGSNIHLIAKKHLHSAKDLLKLVRSLELHVPHRSLCGGSVFVVWAHLELLWHIDCILLLSPHYWVHGQHWENKPVRPMRLQFAYRPNECFTLTPRAEYDIATVWSSFKQSVDTEVKSFWSNQMWVPFKKMTKEFIKYNIEMMSHIFCVSQKNIQGFEWHEGGWMMTESIHYIYILCSDTDLKKWVSKGIGYPKSFTHPLFI